MNKPSLDDLEAMKKLLEESEIRPSYAIVWDPEKEQYIMATLEEYGTYQEVDNES